MGLFDKKYCDICGEKIGLLGNRKLEDGNMCRKCAKKLSPWFTERRQTDIAGIKEQLELRAQNLEELKDFHASYTIGDDPDSGMRVLVDEDAGSFIVTDEDEEFFLDEDTNPDVIHLDEVVEVNLDIDEEKSELTYVDDDGDERHYSPRRYEYSYTFNLQIVLDHPYLDEIKFALNEDPLEIEYSDRTLFGTGEFDPERDSEYRRYLDMADEIMEALTGEEDEDGEYDEDEEEEGEFIEDENGNQIEIVTCPYCGAKSKRTYTGRCENCGGNLDD